MRFTDGLDEKLIMETIHSKRVNWSPYYWIRLLCIYLL